MHFSKALLVGASFVVAALAQSKIAFTQVPAAVTAGTATTLRWSGGDASSVSVSDFNVSNFWLIDALTACDHHTQKG